MNSEYQLIQMGDGMIAAEGKCLQTGKIYRTSPFNKMGWERWRYLRQLIQVALPELNADDREFLISGFSPEGWDEIYGKEDE